ncbi:MAG: NIPSNAP family protein, partial [Hyphomicrobiales bacterium]|nr:NIPSNAP family protein [Hyphomicrobiales bacterium]
MLYELAKLTVQIGSTSKALPGIKAFVEEGKARGELLGCWASEIGELNKIAVLRGFSDSEGLRAERKRLLESSNPFGCRDVLTHMEADSYAPFPDLPPIETGAFGPVYEIRSYALKPGMLAHVMASWRTSLPARIKLSRNLIVMHTIDGPPRFTHIWPYASLEQRAEIRA